MSAKTTRKPAIPTTIIETQISAAGIVETLAPDTSIVVSSTGALVSTDFSTVIFAESFDQAFIINGSLVGGTGIDFGDGVSSQGTFTIGRTGSIMASDNGLSIDAVINAVTNHGTITAGYTGVAIDGLGIDGLAAVDTTSSVINHGEIDGTYAAISMAGGAKLNVINYGTLTGGNASIDTQASTNLTLENYGMIVGDIAASNSDDTILNAGTIVGNLYFGGGNNALINTGTIIGNYSGDVVANYVRNEGIFQGNVYFGSGSDIFDNTNGQVTGRVFAGSGNDFFSAGFGIDKFFASGGIDTLEFTDNGPVLVDLLLHFTNLGAAANDIYNGFENLIGSFQGSDWLRGTHDANLIEGKGGNDTLRAAAGDDTVIGGEGQDLLMGSTGADQFVYNQIDDFGDTILDFRRAHGDKLVFENDDIAVDLSNGALAATAFASNATGLATDADDRFIFRTTDRSVWYDEDGTGVIAGFMVADLQANALVTVADILIA